ncbi:uncharacterized protein LOC108108319 isoform X1 [Drosophila eugracilis]|uniref:uncharacterized protein LOC108108319 isoform X1 n=1 Tax=Drosophila eugracilis TaxID=29029 RepID=UPI0007E878DF|nr:uncharacterized protein LOC108108319 isoform X1 [Drosophila eugracilis]
MFLDLTLTPGLDYPEVPVDGLGCPPGTRGRRPHPHDVYKFLQCGIGVKAQVEQCPQGMIFDSSSLVCVNSDPSRTSYLAFAEVNYLMCPIGAVGLFAHPFDQTKFLNCKDGKVAVQSCQHNYVFSISRGYCQIKTLLAYSDYVSLIISQTNYEYSLILNACPFGVNGIHLYPYDAEKYVQCSSGGRMSIISCGPHKAFSVSQRSCLSRQVVQITDRVKFWEEIQVQTTVVSQNNNRQGRLSPSISCPHNVEKNYAYPFHAGHYIKCQNGVLEIVCCPTGQVYSLSQRRCLSRNYLQVHDYLDYQYISNDFSTEFMVDRSTLTCPPNIQGYYLHPFDCTKFVSCYNQQTFIESCPTGKIFSFSNQKCVPKEECKGSTDHVEYLIETTVITTYEENGPKHENIGDLTCPTGSSGPYPHPFDCTKFLQCSNGQTFIQKCGPGTAFSTAIKNCDFINNVDCSARHLSPGLNQVNHDNQGPSQSPNPSSPTAGHLSDISCPSGVNGQFVHPFDQTKFFLCLAGKLTVQSCQPLYVFSISKGSCQPKTQLVYSDYVRYIVSQISIEQTLNLIACPDGTNGIHPYPYDAGKYVRCSEGQLSVLSCGPQAAFSVVNQACGPSSQIDRQDRVKFWEELVIQTTTTDTNLDNQYDTIPLSSCPASLQGNYTYPFDSNKFVNCQNGRLTIRKCPQTAVYSLPRRQCISDDLLVTVEYLDHGYIFKLFSNSLTEDFSTLVCPTEAEGFHLYPFDCTKYLICKNKQTHVASCKQGEAFSISQRSCVLIDEITLLNDHVECSEEESEEEESEEDRGYAPDGVQQTSGKYQQPSQSSEGRNPPHQPNGGYQQPSQGYGDYQSPSQASGGYQPPYQPNGSNRPTSPNGRPHQQPSSQPGGEYQPHINNGGYQPSFSTNWQPNQTHGAYLPPSQASGGYQPPYNTNGSNQPTSQNGRPHQQPTSQPSGVFQPPYATTGGYQPSPTAWGNQQSNQTHGGYQLPSQAIGGYQPPYNTNGSYQQPSFQPSGVYQPQYATNGGSQPSSSYDWGYQQPNQTHGVYQTPSQPYPSPPYNTNGHQPSSNETYGDRTSSQINGGYQIPHPTNGDYQPSSQTTGGYQKPNIIYGDSQSPSYVSGRVQSQTALDYQQYNDIYEGYQPTSYPNGGYQPGYNTNGSYQQSPQNGRDYQQPNRTYGDQTSSQTTGGYRPPSQASGIFQPSSQTSGGYQIPYPANGDYQPSSQIGWIYQQQNQTYGSSPPHLNGGIQSSSHTTWGSQTNGVLQHPSQTDQGYQPASRSNGGYQTPPQVNLYPSLPTALMCPEKVSGLFPNPFDATGYLTCIEGHTLARQCQPLDIFSISQGYCLPEQHVAKTDRVPFENKLLPQNDPLACPKDLVGFFAYPFDCSKYLSCGPNGMELLRCPIEQHYSISHGFCQPLDQVKREDRLYTLSELHIIYEWTQRMMIAGAVTTCPEGITGTLPHPRFATKYIRCGPGQAEMFDCPSPKVFSVSRRMCLMDDKLRSDDRTDYIVLGASVYWTAPANDNRQSKSFETSGLNQFGNQYTTRTTTTTRVIGDRWTNMNMQRPSGFGLDQNPHHQQQPEYSPGWVTQEISYVQHAPGQNTLYVEGSLQPNRNYPTYKTPLAPMAPSNTGKVYYAQPVEEDEPEHKSPVPSRQNYSRRIDYGSPDNGWKPMPPLAPMGGQKPLNLDYIPHSPGAREQQPQEPLPGQKTIDLDYDDQQKPEDPFYRPLPSPGSPPRFYPDQLPSGSRPIGRQQPVDFHPDQQKPLDPYNSLQGSNIPSRHSPNPLSNESNLYGGLLPPKPDPIKPTLPPNPSTTQTPTPQLANRLHTFPIYPPVGNETPNKDPRHPHYSPSYAGISHSRNASWAKIPVTSTTPDPFNPELGETFYDEDDFSTTTTRQVLVPPPFDHRFYSPHSQIPSSSQVSDPKSQAAMKEALKLMLRPYFNHSGNAQEKLAKQTESAIVSVISRPPITTTTPKSTTTTSTTPRTDLDSDAELIKAGEQESLDSVDDDYVFPDARETSRTEQTLDPSTTYTSTDFQRSTRRAEFDQNTPTTTTMKNNWLASGHNRDYHRRHPNLPDPFSKHHSNPPSHQHHPHQHHQHNADFHRRHPELPNPFPQKDETGQQEELEDDWELMVNPNAEEVTPKLAARSSFNRECDFDCGNGKCLKMDEVCNGQKNCDNGKDEVNCPPLDYEVRLTGGETPNTGRIEVKANGQWGYVCDDKFGLKDADVVCRELGFQMGAQEVRGSSYYPPPNQDFNYLMDEVECHGNETKLSECTFKGWGIHNCGVDEVAGVTCKVPVMKCPNDYWLCHTSKECIPPAFVCDNTPDCADKSDECAAVCQAPVQYRLEGGRNSNEGRLEVKHHGVWGSVCDDDFNLKSAQVACNSMGFYGPAKIEKNIFGNGNGPIWLDQVMCFGNETAIDQCNHWNWGEHNCNHTEDVALHCTAGPPPRSQKYFQSQLKGGMTVGQETAARTYSQIGLWERSSKALHTPRRCGIFKDDLTDEYAHREERVVRGNVAQRGRHPWQATIRTRGRGGISSHWCGAVVISKRHLLTAAHCLYGNPKGAYFVRVGDHYANIAENSEVDTFIENWYTHEKFRKGAHMNNDIAVVVLKTPLRFNDYVQPICLPDKKSDLVEGRKCTISGWGSIKSGVSTPAQVLGSAELPILADNVCKQSNVYGSAMSDGMFCAGSMDESVDACEGDSGGPLVCSDDDGETLYGLISWGQHCGYKNRPGVYVRVSHYIDWIYEKINESLKRL